jgi:phosphopantothenoylcysteine decarboxylase/phosphopantothenate--cysteine ligase
LAFNQLKNKRILITCGPTWVPIDDVRVISNHSTGELGHRLSKGLNRRGAKVTVLEGPVKNHLHEKGVKVKRFTFYHDLHDLLNAELKKKYDVIIHAAAVSDYRLKVTHKTKLSSDFKSMKLELIPTKKLIQTIKRKNRDAILVGFKLESSVTKKGIKDLTADLFEKSRCDYVIANTAMQNSYKGYLVKNDQTISPLEHSRQGIVNALIKELSKRL